MRMAYLKQQQGKAKLLILVALSFLGCSTLKNDTALGDIYTILATDFSKKNKSYIDKYNYFRIRSQETENSGITIYKVSPDYNKAVLGVEGDAYYPKDYLQFKNKFFFIEGEITDKPSEKVFTFFKERDLIDSTMYKLAKGLIKYEDMGDTDGKILTKSKTKVATYVVCKKNNTVISQWSTNKSELSAKNIEKAIEKGCN